jgi:hypothetical protein
VSNGWVPDISHVVWVPAAAYGALATREQMQRVARAVGALNSVLPKRRFILMGPGRWGSRGDIKLGVAVTYADINNTAMLVEIARRRGDHVPDVSFGTHFFQDLVEAQIRYLPLYPDDGKNVFAEDLLKAAPNLLAELLPEYADLADVVRVVDLPATTGGKVLRVLLNAESNEAAAVLVVPGGEDRAAAETVSPTRHEPRQYWRWRFRMAERMVRSLDAAAYGVQAVYLYGSVKSGTAGPGSDIDLLVVLAEDAARERLASWFDGWNGALMDMNFSRSGVRVDPMLDVTFLTAAEVAAGEGLAGKIGAATDAARELGLG